MSREVRVSAKTPCPKCGGKEFSMAEVFIHGGKGARLINFPSKRFTTFTCVQCAYTEFYKLPMKQAFSLIDHNVSSF